jgi:predicted AAA+ superfamily ATPase
LSQEEDFLRKETSLKQHLFKDATSAVANNIGFPFSLTKISQNHRDAKSVLTLLSDWHILLPCQQKSFSNTTTFHPKVYLYDVGLTKFLRESSLPSLSIIETIDSAQRTSLGGLLENAVYLNLLTGKGFLNNISGWKKNNKNASEIDFIIKTDNASIPLEVKAAKKIHEQYLNPIFEYLNLSQQKIGFITSCDLPFKKNKEKLTIFNIPIYLCETKLLHKLSAVIS